VSFVVSPIIRLAPHQYYGLLRLLIQHPSGLHLFGLYLPLERFCTAHWMRPLLFHRLLSQHPALPTPESSSRLFQVQYRFCCLRGAKAPLGSLLLPFGANMSVLQVSLYVTGCCFASLSQGVTTLRHSQSPSHIGCLLSGGLTLTRTGLSPVSRR
jgi:hypothetical protein